MIARTFLFTNSTTAKAIALDPGNDLIRVIQKFDVGAAVTITTGINDDVPRS